MSLSLIKLDLDPTGTSLDNRILAEPHTLSSALSKAIAPHAGAFFAASVQLMDGATLLSRGVDYQIVELHQEATLRYGKEISSVILVINPHISPTVSLTYQALGGHFAATNKAIANLYETVIQDNRPVDWTHVFNKPSEFTPTIHRHLLDDVFGFEPVVDYLERIKRAITLGQTDVLVSVVDRLLAQFDCRDLPKVLPSTKMMQYDSFLYFMSRKKLLSNTWIDTVDCQWHKGDSAYFEIDSSAHAVGTPLYWELYRPNGEVAIFTSKKGVAYANGGIVQVSIYVPSENFATNDLLYLGVKADKTQEDYDAVTYRINIVEHVTTDSAYGFVYNSASVPNQHESFAAEIANSLERRTYYTLAYP